MNTEPSGAKVETSNGHQCPATPCAIKISRKAEFTATITKAGYKPATVSFVAMIGPPDRSFVLAHDRSSPQSTMGSKGGRHP